MVFYIHSAFVVKSVKFKQSTIDMVAKDIILLKCGSVAYAVDKKSYVTVEMLALTVCFRSKLLRTDIMDI